MWLMWTNMPNVLQIRNVMHSIYLTLIAINVYVWMNNSLIKFTVWLFQRYKPIMLNRRLSVFCKQLTWHASLPPSLTPAHIMSLLMWSFTMFEIAAYIVSHKLLLMMGSWTWRTTLETLPSENGKKFRDVIMMMITNMVIVQYPMQFTGPARDM